MIRTLCLSAALTCIAAAPSARADRLTAAKPKAFERSGAASLQRVEGAESPILVLGDGGSARIALEVPAPAAVDGLDPKGWFVRLRVDVRVPSGVAKFEVLVEPDHNGPGAPLGRSRASFGGEYGGSERTKCLTTAPAGGATLGPEGGTLRLELHSSGSTTEVHAVRLERYHVAPTKKLIGKANGKLGPDQLSCGALGFTALTEHECTAFSVLDVRQGGPAAAAGLRVGDVVVAIDGQPLAASSIAPGWRWFEESHEASLGRAIESSLEMDAPAVRLEVLRLGESVPELTVPVPFRKGGGYDGFPLRGELAAQLRADLVDWTVTHQKKNGGWPGTDAVNPALGALALLGTGDDEHLPAVARAVELLRAKNPSPSKMRGLAYWPIAFQGMLFCELHLRTGDTSVLPWIEEAATWLPTTTHECKWGMQAFGHGPDGLPYDNKALMAPAAHLLVFDALAGHCGVDSRIWAHIEPYVRDSWSNPADGGHGAMGYNASYRDKGEFWSRTGLCALAEVLRARANAPTDDPLAPALCVLMEERHPWMLNSHAYGEPGAALGLLALAVVKPTALDGILPLWRWRFLCAWEPDHGLRYTTPHMGAPYMGQESVVNLGYLLLFSTVNRGLRLSGGA